MGSSMHGIPSRTRRPTLWWTAEAAPARPKPEIRTEMVSLISGIWNPTPPSIPWSIAAAVQDRVRSRTPMAMGSSISGIPNRTHPPIPLSTVPDAPLLPPRQPPQRPQPKPPLLSNKPLQPKRHHGMTGWAAGKLSLPIPDVLKAPLILGGLKCAGKETDTCWS